ncbi:MAG TPA: deoxyribonuclease IV [Acidobacteriota bacterium]|nr:deoxyribonuclease IV [Acidobacteriota bacterium]
MTGPRLGAHMSIAGGVDLAVDRGVSVGCDTIQIFTKNSNQWRAKPLLAEDIAGFKQKLERSGINPVVAHDSYLINLASPEPELLERSRNAFFEEMKRAEALGIPYLVMHPGSHKGSGVDAGLRTIAESFDLLHEKTAGLQLAVLLETTAGQGTNLGFTFEQLRRIIDMTSEGGRLGVCLDTCHAFTAGYDIATSDGYGRMWQEFDGEIGLDRLKVIHLNDSKKDLGSRVDRHEHIGKGTLGLEPFRMLVNDERLREIPMILETPKGPDYAEDKENLAILRNMIE